MYKLTSKSKSTKGKTTKPAKGKKTKPAKGKKTKRRKSPRKKKTPVPKKQPVAAEAEPEEDLEDSIARKQEELATAVKDLQALEEEKVRVEEEKLAKVRDKPTAFVIHRELINVSVDPPLCDMHVTIEIPSGDITFHEKIEVKKRSETPVERRDLIRDLLGVLIDKHRPPVYVSHDGNDVVGRFSLDGEFEELAKELAQQKREDLDQKAAALGLVLEDYDKKYDLALAIVLKEWRPPA